MNQGTNEKTIRFVSVNLIEVARRKKKTRLISIVSKPIKIMVVVVVVFVQKRQVQKMFGWV